MSNFIDISVDHINKKNEELCGDHVEITKNDNSTIVVLSDGLGSGVKANILSTLTSNIAATMLKQGSDIFEVINTLEKTLPVCKVRNLAYATFTIIQLFDDGTIYCAEFDNPKIAYIRNKSIYEPTRKQTKFQDKTILEFRAKYQKDDIITFFSDGVVHAGIENFLVLGWQYEEIVEVLLRFAHKQKTSKAISKEVIDIANAYYRYEPGDDTTCVVIKIRDEEKITLFSGPPKEEVKDEEIASDLVNENGKKIICGGTAANIIARELNENIESRLDTLEEGIPPIAQIRGIDLVTEGVLTMTEAIKIMEDYSKPNFNNQDLIKNNGASKLANLLINECTHLKVLHGNAINPAHQNPFFKDELSIKWKTIQALIETVKQLGKEVEVVSY
ncbi:SpoIIE family protein phosphatase [Mycoplasmatota bacterium WC44]